MRMWMSSMFAVNRYYPGEITRSSQDPEKKKSQPCPLALPVYPPGYVNETATMPANYPTNYPSRARSTASLYSSVSRENLESCTQYRVIVRSKGRTSQYSLKSSSQLSLSSPRWTKVRSGV